MRNICPKAKWLWMILAIILCGAATQAWAQEESIESQLRNVDREVARERSQLKSEERAAAKKRKAAQMSVNDDDNAPERNTIKNEGEEDEVNFGGRSSRDRREARERNAGPLKAKTGAEVMRESVAAGSVKSANNNIKQNNIKNVSNTEKEESKEMTHWINSKSKVRHNKECRYYGKGKNGKPCGPNDGRACKVCGG